MRLSISNFEPVMRLASVKCSSGLGTAVNAACNLPTPQHGLCLLSFLFSCLQINGKFY